MQVITSPETYRIQCSKRCTKLLALAEFGLSGGRFQSSGLVAALTTSNWNTAFSIETLRCLDLALSFHANFRTSMGEVLSERIWGLFYGHNASMQGIGICYRGLRAFIGFRFEFIN